MLKISIKMSYTSSLISMQFGVKKPHSQSGQPENHSDFPCLKPQKLSETAESCMAWSIRAVVGCCPEPKGPKFTSLAAENAVKYSPINGTIGNLRPKKRHENFFGYQCFVLIAQVQDFFGGCPNDFEPHLERYPCVTLDQAKGYVSHFGVQWVKNHPNSPGFFWCFLHLKIPKNGEF